MHCSASRPQEIAVLANVSAFEDFLAFKNLLLGLKGHYRVECIHAEPGDVRFAVTLLPGRPASGEADA